MRWIGWLTALIVAQILFLGIFLFALGRLPERELDLLWTAVWTGESQLDQKPSPDEGKLQEETSYADLLAARTNEAREIERKRQELASLAQAAQARVDAAAATEKAATKTLEVLKNGITTKEEQYVKEGKAKVLSLVEAMPPKLAKSYLLDQARTDENSVLEVIQRLDPVLAAKIFKEFKQPAELGKLNGWLAKLGQGEPEVSQVRELKAKLPADDE
jgi:hypothetical protein